MQNSVVKISRDLITVRIMETAIVSGSAPSLERAYQSKRSDSAAGTVTQQQKIKSNAVDASLRHNCCVKRK
jgi:hypothetical protein